MATSNFNVRNANNYYVIPNVGSDFCTSEYFQMFEFNGWEYFSEDDTLCKTFWYKFGEIEIGIDIEISINAGYYQGAVLDFELKPTKCFCFSYSQNDYENIEDFANEYAEYLLDGFYWCYHGAIANNFKKCFEKFLYKLNEIANEQIQNMVGKENIYGVSARFSNGETWYSKLYF